MTESNVDPVPAVAKELSSPSAVQTGPVPESVPGLEAAPSSDASAIAANAVALADVGAASPRATTVNAIVAKMMPLDQIDRDSHFQIRAGLTEVTVQEYADLMKDGCMFPPITPVRVGGGVFVVDGFHRLAAAAQAGLTELPANIIDCSEDDAVWAAAGANATHGLAMSSAEKRVAVARVLGQKTLACKGNRLIAARCGCSEWLVRQVREEATARNSQLGDCASQGDEAGIREYTRGGRKQKMRLGSLARAGRRRKDTQAVTPATPANGTVDSPLLLTDPRPPMTLPPCVPSMEAAIASAEVVDANPMALVLQVENAVRAIEETLDQMAGQMTAEQRQNLCNRLQAILDRVGLDVAPAGAEASKE
ncbi:MAG: ParB N-terminal domain-containing protein, partial [Planctomycetota bacterium]|nr:ParB N-terminal domain-containing protein [Planctomycetota bacterium]